MDPTEDRLVEPWMRGPIPGVSPLLSGVLYSFQQTLEDLEKFTAHLTDRQIWDRPHGLASLGFQMQHIAGSVDRLSTYLIEGSLTEAQFLELRGEALPGPGRQELMARMRETFSRVGGLIGSIDVATLSDARAIGRKRLPATVAGLLVHIAEHTQRHLGQAIITAKLLPL